MNLEGLNKMNQEIKEKLSERLYQINANISAMTYITKQRLTLEHQAQLNSILAETIKTLRELNK